MRDRNPIALAAATLLLSPWLAAQTPGAGAMSMQSTAPGKGSVTNTVEIVATVVAIDKASRIVTLKGPGGNTLPVEAGPDVKNFDRIAVGDQVAARYLEALTVELVKSGSAPIARVESQAGGTAGPGARPAARGGRQVRVTAEIVALDPATQVATLRGPARTIDVKVAYPNQFSLAKVGDQVEATYTEAFAISVEPVAARK
jgi:hypothetical protein